MVCNNGRMRKIKIERVKITHVDVGSTFHSLQVLPLFFLTKCSNYAILYHINARYCFLKL